MLKANGSSGSNAIAGITLSPVVVELVAQSADLVSPPPLDRAETPEGLLVAAQLGSCPASHLVW